MEEQAIYKTKKIVTIEDVYSGIGYIGNTENIDEILSSHPKMEWLKEHPDIKGHWYLPIDKVEFLLERLFYTADIAIMRVVVNDKNVTVVVNIGYIDKCGKQRYTSGIGSVEINEKQNVSMASPLAESLAIKDAAEHLGNIFGRNLNRNDTIKIVKGKINTESDTILIEVKNKAEKAKSVSEIEELYKTYSALHPKLRNHIKAICSKRSVNLHD